MQRPSLFGSRARLAAFLGLGIAGGAGAVGGGCSGDVAATTGTGAGRTSTTTTTTPPGAPTGTGGAGGAGGGTTTSTTSGTTTSTTTGAGGNGGGGGGWPTCDSPPVGAAQKTLHEIWQDDPAAPTPVWVPGVYVTGVSQGGCVAGSACQIFVQQGEQYADLAAGSQQALKIFVSGSTAQHFTSIAVGDQVDVYANAWRYDVDGQNELLLQVNQQLPGCAKKVGAGDPQPVTVLLSDLTLTAYEDTVGPLLVKVNDVSGKPALPDETFGLWTTGVFIDAGPESIVSLSPYFLSGGAFSGLVQGQTTSFTSVTGVFGVFFPAGPDAGPAIKYKEIYPRAMSEVVVQ